MKIAFSAFLIGKAQTGISTYILNLLQSLSALDQTNTYDIFLSKASRAHLPLLKENFSLFCSPNFVDHPLWNVLWHYGSLPLKGKYSLVHIPSIRRLPIALPCPLVLTVHDMALFGLEKKYDRMRNFYHREILSRLIFGASRIIAVSAYTKADIVRFTGYPEDKIEVIYSGINTHLFFPQDKVEAQQVLKERYGVTAPFFVYVSRVEHPGKNHVNLIKAFELYKKKFQTEHQLLLAGADWSGAEVVKELAAKSAYEKEIRFLGYVPTQDIVSLYSACEMMLFPSLYEGFGFPLLEAMACGAPVACADTTSLKELAEGYAELFDPLDPGSIASAMERVLAWQDRPLRLERAQAYARSFSWRRAAEETLAVYQKVL